MQTFDQYLPPAKYGAKLQGHNASTNNFYYTIAVGTTGPTAVNVFGAATAPTAGTITAFWLTTANPTGGSAGTFTLFGTTAGTIATIPNVGTSALFTGSSVGTAVLNAAVAAGDTVTITGLAGGTSTAFIAFQTAS